VVMQRTKVACDACRRRKVRCNGEQKCQQCTHLGLDCRYPRSDPSSRSRSSTTRGHVVGSLKTERQHQTYELTPRPSAASVSRSLPSLVDKLHMFGGDMAFFESLIEDYEESVFSFIPIIPKAELLQCIREMGTNRQSCALAHALAAMTLSMRPPQDGYETVRSQVIRFATRALEIRGPIMPHQELNMRNAVVCIAVSACLLGNNTDHDVAFFYLREAVTCIQILGTEDRQGMHPLSQSRLQRQRLYWLLFVHERFAAVSLFRPPILSPLMSLPEADPSVSPGIHLWFTCIIQLFTVLDDTFVDNWINKHSRLSVDLAWLQSKQAHLDRCMNLSEHQRQSLTDMQQIDLTATDLWLRSLLWKIALSKLLLTNHASADSWSIFFPLRLSHQLQVRITSIPRTAVEIHGAGILQKIFDITNTLAEIIIHVPRSSEWTDTNGRIADFVLLHNYLHDMSRFSDAEKEILEEKCQKIRVLVTRSHAGRGMRHAHLLSCQSPQLHSHQ